MSTIFHKIHLSLVCLTFLTGALILLSGCGPSFLDIPYKSYRTNRGWRGQIIPEFQEDYTLWSSVVTKNHIKEPSQPLEKDLDLHWVQPYRIYEMINIGLVLLNIIFILSSKLITKNEYKMIFGIILNLSIVAIQAMLLQYQLNTLPIIHLFHFEPVGIVESGWSNGILHYVMLSQFLISMLSFISYGFQIYIERGVKRSNNVESYGMMSRKY